MSSRIKKAHVLAAIPESGGIISIIAKKLGCAWSTAKAAIDAYPETQQAYADEMERMLDLAESKLYDSINAGDTQDVKWFLSKRGKKRGYGENLDITSGGEKIKAYVGWSPDEWSKDEPKE